MKRKKILILGASSDIGKEVVKILIKNSWDIYAHYNSNKKLLSKINSNTKNFKIDFLASEKIIEKKINNILRVKFDAYINLVGFADNNSFEKFKINNFLNSLKVNSVVPFFIIKKIVKNMIKNKWGRIVQTSSIGVKFGGGKNTFNYSASKHLNEFIPKDVKEWSKSNILYNVVRIGVTDTKFHKKIKNKNLKRRASLIPINRVAKPSEIAELIYFLISEKNTYITGETISISGGE